MTNAIYLKAGRKEITPTQASAAISLLHSDLEAGFMALAESNLGGSFHDAEMIAERYAAKTLARSLDILHVAIAMSIGCTEFVSFDRRQRTLAKSLGLKVLPRRTNLSSDLRGTEGSGAGAVRHGVLGNPQPIHGTTTATVSALGFVHRARFIRSTGVCPEAEGF